MYGSGMLPITPTLFFDGENLIENDQRIPLSSGAERKILTLLLQSRGDNVSFERIYQGAFQRRHVPDDPVKSVQQAVSKLTKKSKALRECIKPVRGVGYRLDSLGSLQLVPQFIRGATDAKGKFAPCDNNIPREEELLYLQNHAFIDSNVFAICGSPGMGKTELAKAFVLSCCGREDVSVRLRYQYVIFATFHRDGLRATITNLPCEAACSAAERYSLVLERLRERKDSLLLVIDNVDIEPESLTASSREYNDLLGCGCHILLTSRRDLVQCPGIRRMELPPLKTEQLAVLFRRVAGPDWQEEEAGRLEYLIERLLQRNTYLVLLAAGLMDSLQMENLIQAFEIPGELDALDAVSSVCKDGKKQASNTLMGHFKQLYDLKKLDSYQQQLLLMMAFLPTMEGMDNTEFFRRAFPKTNRVRARIAFKKLLEKHWVFQRNRSVYLHPMVKELLLIESDKKYDQEVQFYLQNTADNLNHTFYSQALLTELTISTAAFDAAQIRNIKTFASAQLTAQIASAYDTLTNKFMAYSFGIEAKRLLDHVNSQTLSRDGLYRLAQSYNVTGYAIVHYQNGEYHRLAVQALEEADAILENLLLQSESAQESESCMILRSKIAGNLAASYHAAGDYINAKAKHEENLAYRQNANKASCGKYTDLIAAAHKSLATEYYYLAGQENRAENLKISYENHSSAVSLYAQLGTSRTLDWCIAVNRMVGTGLLAAESCTEEECRDILSLTVEDFLSSCLKMMSQVMNYLITIAPMEDELRDCIRSTVRILQLRPPTGAHILQAKELLKTVQMLPIDVQHTLHSSLEALQKIL